MACRGKCDQLAIQVHRDSNRNMYDGTQKRCSKCAKWFSYNGINRVCPCCNWKCRTTVLRWGKRRLDTRVRIG